MKNGAFEPNIAPRKIRSKLCSHSKISPNKNKQMKKKNQKNTERERESKTQIVNMFRMRMHRKSRRGD